MTAATAAAEGFRPLTAPYFVKKESAMLNAVVEDLKRGGIEFTLIETAPGRTEVWRRGWVDDALIVKEMRDEVAAAWQTGIPAVSPHPSVQSVPTGGGAVTVKTATKERPYVNSLGMKFVPVAGTKVLFCVWETRVKDYEAFGAATGHEGKKPDYAQTGDHPAVNVNWEDAKAFCEWLSNKESLEYRLSSDEEWSAAVGLRGEKGETPSDKNGKVADVYPWGMQWVQRKRAGNYGQSLGTDTFEKTAPVGSFAANGFGIYDLGGNVWEWCEDSFYSSRNSRVIRGASWVDVDSVTLRSSCRHGEPPSDRHGNVGFRLVVSGR